MNDNLAHARTVSTLGLSKFLLPTAFVTAVYAALTQFSEIQALSGSALRLAYFAFPFLIFSIFLAVYAYSWPLIRTAWKNKRWKWFSWLVGIGYVLFYILATNTVSVPEPDVPIPANLAKGYVAFLMVYGPMAVWPDVEFYFPSVNLVGYFSVGSLLFYASLGLLTAFAVSLLMQNVCARKHSRRNAAAPIVASIVAAVSTNACCCCTPVILPALTLLFAGALPNVIAESLVNPQSPVSNLLTLATLTSLLTSVILSTRTFHGERSKLANPEKTFTRSF